MDTGSLVMKQGVDLYGGFAGTETQRDERDWDTHPTIISGATSRGGLPAYHVIVGADNPKLDGLAVIGGRAVSGALLLAGGGMYCRECPSEPIAFVLLADAKGRMIWLKTLQSSSNSVGLAAVRWSDEKEFLVRVDANGDIPDGFCAPFAPRTEFQHSTCLSLPLRRGGWAGSIPAAKHTANVEGISHHQ
ncbi:MAG: hypothetical protein HY706_14785 [Candidatus Hydrogenedentes bacterium]|nr:hypothetical protein [Candidatus Hydrogenedentota bacterium]